MANASIAQMLTPTYTAKAVSRVASGSNFIMSEFGMQPGGPNEMPVHGRKFSYDIFNDTRKIGKSTAPNQPFPVSTRNPVGTVANTIPRMADSLILLLDELHNYRAIGGPQVYDAMGAKNIEKYQRILGQKASNFRMALIGGMLRGKIYGHAHGTELYYDYTSTSPIWTVDFQMPTGNLTQLDMLGAGNILNVSWANPQANIPYHLMQINAAFQQLVGSSLQVCIVNSSTWNYIVNNDYVLQLAGAVNKPFEIWSRQEGTSQNGRKWTVQNATINAFPLCRFIITDEGLDLGTPGSETYTKFIPDGYAWFGPEPSSDYFEMLVGDEPISKGPNVAASPVRGLDAWTVPNHNPTSVQMFILDNCMPTLYVPASTAFAQVVF